MTEIPTDKILQLREQSLDNDQIIQTLQKDGYKSSQIFDALQQAELKESIGGPMSLSQDFSTQNPISPDLPEPPLNLQTPSTSMDSNKVEEIAEAIIDEKWDIIVESVNKIADWKEVVDSKLDQLSSNLEEIHRGFAEFKDNISSQVTDYESEISDLKTDIVAMNKVLKKALPDIVSGKIEIHEDSKEELDEIAEEHHTKSEEIFEGTSIDDIN
jgi:predicted transcriptional regulator